MTFIRESVLIPRRAACALAAPEVHPRAYDSCRAQNSLSQILFISTGIKKESGKATQKPMATPFNHADMNSSENPILTNVITNDIKTDIKTHIPSDTMIFRLIVVLSAIFFSLDMVIKVSIKFRRGLTRPQTGKNCSFGDLV
jgi:hypothetical protein